MRLIEGGAKSCSCYGALLWRLHHQYFVADFVREENLYWLVSRCQQNTVVRCGWLFPHLRLEERINGLEFLQAEDLVGERNGYHRRGEPWAEERYSGFWFWQASWGKGAGAGGQGEATAIWFQAEFMHGDKKICFETQSEETESFHFKPLLKYGEGLFPRSPPAHPTIYFQNWDAPNPCFLLFYLIIASAVAICPHMEDIANWGRAGKIYSTHFVMGEGIKTSFTVIATNAAITDTTKW